jgi:hypothetical protein
MLLILLIGTALAVLGAQVASQTQNTTTCTDAPIATTTLFTAPATTQRAAYTIFGYRQGFEAVHQYWNANDEKFYLGGAPSTYCPDHVQSLSACPAGNVTAFLGLLDLVSSRIRAIVP